jgi:phosphoribosylformimino-5-aminoimidazole carboxamide ribotide isomerase
MTLFRPCIDLHDGHVKQIVGGSLRDGTTPRTNFVSEHSADYYAALYREAGLGGGHVILLGPGNETAARAALKAFPGGLQVGGGITLDNAQAWIDAGASHVIVTSWLFPEGLFSMERLKALSERIGAEKLVIDLSCRRIKSENGEAWNVAINRWQTITDVTLNRELFTRLDLHCAEYLVHAADVEGLRQGLDWKLVAHLSQLTDKPLTYAGGASSRADLERMKVESNGRMDLTIGSALDIFGGHEVMLTDCIAFNKAQMPSRQG